MKKLFQSLCLLVCICSVAKAQSPGAIIDVLHYNFAIQLNDQNDTIKGQADIAVRYVKDAGSF